MWENVPVRFPERLCEPGGDDVMSPDAFTAAFSQSCFFFKPFTPSEAVQACYTITQRGTGARWLQSVRQLEPKNLKFSIQTSNSEPSFHTVTPLFPFCRNKMMFNQPVGLCKITKPIFHPNYDLLVLAQQKQQFPTLHIQLQLAFYTISQI